jgi:TLC domain
MTGGLVQLINGVFLLVTFFGARLAYGTYMSVYIMSDIYRALRLARNAPHTPPLALSPFAMNATTLFEDPTAALQVVRYSPETPHVPVLLWGVFLASNITSHALNFYWYGKMISAIRKRFDPPFGTRAVEKKVEKTTVERGVDEQGRKTLEVDSVEVRRRAPVRMESSEIPPA